MNWIDIVLIVTLGAGTFVGLRTGLIKAAFFAIGVFVGWLLAGQFSGDLANILVDNVRNHTLATVISYAIIIALVIVASLITARIIKPVLTIFTLGFAALIDKVGGATLGFVVGILISGAFVAMLARLTFDFEIPVDGIAGEVASTATQIENVKGTLERHLLESSMVPTYLETMNWLPAATVGLAPDSFRLALEELDRKQNEQDR